MPKTNVSRGPFLPWSGCLWSEWMIRSVLRQKCMSTLLTPGSPWNLRSRLTVRVYTAPGSCDAWQFVAERRQDVSLSCENSPARCSRSVSVLKSANGKRRKLGKVGKAVSKLQHAPTMWAFARNIFGDRVRALFSELGPQPRTQGSRRPRNWSLLSNNSLLRPALC